MSKATHVAALAIVLLASPASAQNATDAVQRGAQAYRICAACHSLQPGVHLSGPSLAGRWGEEAGTIPDFGRYTEALKKSGVVWNESTLDGWIEKPQSMIPETTMTFRGVDSRETRKDLIEFLRRALAPGGASEVVKSGLIPQSMALGPVPDDVSSSGDNQRIKSIHHCKDAYHVTTADGAQFPFWETNVRIKVDTSRYGPGKGAPVLLRSGMAGDRVSVVFSNIDDLRRLLDEKC